MKTPRSLFAVIAVFGVLGLSACGGDNAETVSENLSKKADRFEVQRHIVGINGITDKVLFDVEGKCSIARDGDLVVTCKHGPNDYRKHFIGLSDNVTYVNTQTDGLDVSEYRTKIVIRPESVVPDLDLVTGDER